MVTARRFTVIIEEKLLLKLLAFFGYGKTEGGMSSTMWSLRSKRLSFSKTISASQTVYNSETVVCFRGREVGREPV